MGFKKISFLIFSLSLLIYFGAFIRIIEASEIVKLSYIPISNNSNGEVFTMKTKLKITNINETPITNVVISVYNATNVGINSAPVLFDTINSGESKISQESFLITHSASQEKPNGVIVWQIQYTNSDGDNISEVISL